MRKDVYKRQAIYSGTTPSMNGIISQRWMDASTLRPVNSTDDTAFMGYYTDQTVAPTKLLTSTIADELKIATQMCIRDRLHLVYLRQISFLTIVANYNPCLLYTSISS